MLYMAPLMEEATFESMIIDSESLGSSVKVDSPSFIWSKKLSLIPLLLPPMVSLKYSKIHLIFLV